LNAVRYIPSAGGKKNTTFEIKIASMEKLPFMDCECLAAIEKLGLTQPEWQALRTQGFVTAEPRGRRTTIYRLRFRCAGRQQCKYIGTNRRSGLAVQIFLARHQQQHHVEQRMQSRLRKIQQVLRTVKTTVGPYLAEAGLHYHGNSIRRSRTIRGEPSSKNNDAIGSRPPPTSF